MLIKLDKQELEELMRLTHEARNTPVIALSLAAGLRGEDFSSQAWQRVRNKWEELGKKYGFEPTRAKGIDSVTGEVVV